MDAMGFRKPTPIQEQAIPVILEQKDLIAVAQTGTGKTAAYLLPVMNRIITEQHDEHEINTLILAPTRELALQIDQQLQGLSYFCSISSISIYGGGDGAGFDQQKKALTTGADVVIATPGKIISHLNLGYVKIGQLKHLILDEADRMLDMGFYEDIMRIISFLPKSRQTLLFSATMPPKIRELASLILNEPHQINIAISKPAERIQQGAFMVYDTQKIGLIKSILAGKKIPSIIIFASTKLKVKEIEKELRREGLPVKAIHSDLEQSEREAVLNLFRDRQVQNLVATDILARGIDIESISLVINYDVPNDAEDYIHRIGRTARAENKGVAITFVNEEDQQKFHRIEKLIGKTVTKYKIPAELGEAPRYEPEKKRSFHKGKKPMRKPKSSGK
jgi:ATP-dependent RNA helicase RhlE